jgi:hypothetical protein
MCVLVGGRRCGAKEVGYRERMRFHRMRESGSRRTMCGTASRKWANEGCDRVWEGTKGFGRRVGCPLSFGFGASCFSYHKWKVHGDNQRAPAVRINNQHRCGANKNNSMFLLSSWDNRLELIRFTVTSHGHPIKHPPLSRSPDPRAG